MKRMPDRGFTLIEVLVATAIFTIIVLGMSQVFHQSTVAWDTGMRKAEGNTMGRAILGFIAREMAEAVAYTNELGQGNVGNNLSGVRFVTLGGETEDGSGAKLRIARMIEYQLVSGQDVIVREEQVCKMTSGPGSGYGSWDVTPEGQVIVATNVAKFKFWTSDGKSHTDDLPDWVRIELAIRRQDEVSGVGVYSYGPDGVQGGDDDVESW